jgi:hypothetical protein
VQCLADHPFPATDVGFHQSTQVIPRRFSPSNRESHPMATRPAPAQKAPAKKAGAKQAATQSVAPPQKPAPTPVVTLKTVFAQLGDLARANDPILAAWKALHGLNQSGKREMPRRLTLP